MSYINVDECEAAGFTPDQLKKIESIARRISKAAKEAKEMNIEIFGASGSGELRFADDPNKGGLKLACLDGIFDGGDGSDYAWGDGLMRGES